MDDGLSVYEHLLFSAIVIPLKDELVVIYLHQIDYIEAENNSCKIYCTGAKLPYYLRVTLKEIEEELPPMLFCRIHASYIISTRFLKKFNKRRTRVCITEDNWLPIGRSYKEAILRLLKFLPKIKPTQDDE